MSKEKSPAFQFYPRDWLSDPNITELSYEQEGWYIHLICYCWLEGDIPEDPASVLRILGIRSHDIDELEECELLARLNKRNDDIAELLSICFTASSKKGRLVHPRIEKERKAQEARRRERSESGKRGGKASAKKRLENPSSAWKKVQANLTTASSSSSSSSNKTPQTPQGADGNGHKNTSKYFDIFWKSYPRKEAKQPAYKSFWKINPSEDLLGIMVDWLEQAKDSEQWQDMKLIPHPSTWLNQRRWEGNTPPPRNFTIDEDNSLLKESYDDEPNGD